MNPVAFCPRIYIWHIYNADAILYGAHHSANHLMQNRRRPSFQHSPHMIVSVLVLLLESDWHFTIDEAICIQSTTINNILVILSRSFKEHKLTCSSNLLSEKSSPSKWLHPYYPNKNLPFLRCTTLINI